MKNLSLQVKFFKCDQSQKVKFKFYFITFSHSCFEKIIMIFLMIENILFFFFLQIPKFSWKCGFIFYLYGL
jgi:hypothetical protein